MITRDKFSDEQEKAFTYCMDFVTDPLRKVAVVRGYAGTGKTAMMHVLVKELEAKKKKVVCTAPTNEAVRVLSKLTGKKYAQTIYGLLGLVMKEEDDNGFVLVKDKEPQIDKYHIIIIDEASMINIELYDIIVEEMKVHSKCKVIFVGDPAQLPPVNDPNNLSKVFLTDDYIEMTNIQRTVIGNPIISVATNIRQNLSSPKDVFSKETVIMDDGISGLEYVDDPHEFMRMIYADFCSEQYEEDSNYIRVLAYTNRAVDGLNFMIRQKLWKSNEPPEYVVGDKLLVDSPVFDNTKSFPFPIYNVGERLEVLAADKYTHELGFDYWFLLVNNYEEDIDEQREFELWVPSKITERTYNKKLSELAETCKQNAAKTISGKSRVNMYTRFEAWKPYFDFKSQFHRVRYNYALTVHKSQGSTFKRVYVFEKDLDKLTWNNTERNKLKYVAFTRASQLLRIL